MKAEQSPSSRSTRSAKKSRRSDIGRAVVTRSTEKPRRRSTAKTTAATPPSKPKRRSAVAKSPKAKKPTPSKRASKKDGKAKPPSLSRLNSNLFYKIIWECLLKLGWSLDKGTRPTDLYFLPPGVRRGQDGSIKRVDFFDSFALVLKFIRNDDRWKDKAEVKECLRLFDACLALVVDLRQQGNLPEGELQLEWLLTQLDK
jgi:hypothetical protein